MLRFALVAGLAGLIATAAVAQPAANAPAGAPEPSTNSAMTADTSANTDPDKVICKNVKPPTGTRLGSSRNRQRVCQTKAEWDQQELEAQEMARSAINEGRNTSPDH